MTDEFELPKAVIGRLVKDALPDGVNVAKDARSAFAAAARVFISYATAAFVDGRANELAQSQGRKTLTSADILAALTDLELAEFAEPLKQALEVFHKEQQGKKAEAQKRKAERAKDAPDASTTEGAAEIAAEASDEEEAKEGEDTKEEAKEEESDDDVDGEAADADGATQPTETSMLVDQ